MAYTTIMTMMNILERKGYLAKGRSGKAFIYTAVYSRDEIVRDILRELVDVFYSGSAEPVLNMLSGECGDRSCPSP